MIETLDCLVFNKWGLENKYRDEIIEKIEQVERYCANLERALGVERNGTMVRILG